MRSLWRRLGLLAGVALAAVLLVDWLWTSDKDRVVAALGEMEAGLEARDAARVAERFALEVALDGPIPFLPSGRALGDALATTLAKIDRLTLSRDETTIEFPADGIADVAIRGSGGVGHREYGPVCVPFHFELLLELEREPDRRFVLTRVKKAEIEPGLGF